MAHYIDYTILSFPAKVKVSTSGGELSKPLKKEMESLVYFFPGRRLQSGAIRGIIYGEQILASVDKSPHGFPGPGQQLAMLRENSKTRRALRRVFRKAEDAGA